MYTSVARRDFSLNSCFFVAEGAINGQAKICRVTTCGFDATVSVFVNIVAAFKRFFCSVIFV